MENTKMSLTVQSAMQMVAKYSLGTLLILATASFFSLTIFKTDYYLQLFDSRWGTTARWLAWLMAIGVSVITEAIRLGLLVASARDFSLRNFIGGWLGLVGSIALTFYDWQIADTVAKIWQIDSVSISNIFRFLVVVGLLIELRLILMLFGGLEGKPGKGRRESKVRQNGHYREEMAIPGLD